MLDLTPAKPLEEGEYMPDQIITLPFSVPDLLAGFAEGNGLAKGSPAELTLEFVVKDSFLNLLKSGMKEIRIPRSEIDAVRFKRGWFGAKVCIRVKSLKWLADLPGCDSGEVTLHIARRDRDLAGEFARLFSGTAI
jgi:hypothetical protein